MRINKGDVVRSAVVTIVAVLFAAAITVCIGAISAGNDDEGETVVKVIMSEADTRKPADCYRVVGSISLADGRFIVNGGMFGYTLTIFDTVEELVEFVRAEATRRFSDVPCAGARK